MRKKNFTGFVCFFLSLYVLGFVVFFLFACLPCVVFVGVGGWLVCLFPRTRVTKLFSI